MCVNCFSQCLSSISLSQLALGKQALHLAAPAMLRGRCRLHSSVMFLCTCMHYVTNLCLQLKAHPHRATSMAAERHHSLFFWEALSVWSLQANCVSSRKQCSSLRDETKAANNYLLKITPDKRTEQRTPSTAPPRSVGERIFLFQSITLSLCCCYTVLKWL